jgi:hypothetical protein
VSEEPVKRGRDGRRMNPRSLENLRRGVTRAPKGNGHALRHGANTTGPQDSVDWDPAMSAAIDDLQQRVHASLRDQDGQLFPWAVPSVEAVAIQRVASVRMARYIATAEAKGSLTPKDLDLQSQVGERYHRAL